MRKLQHKQTHKSNFIKSASAKKALFDPGGFFDFIVFIDRIILIMTISEFIDNEVKTLAEGDLEDLTTTMGMRFLNRALVFRYNEIVQLCPDVYNVWKYSVTTSSDGIVALPADASTESEILIYENKNDDIPIADDYYKINGRNIYFTDEKEATYYLDYNKIPSRYSDINDELLETDYRAIEILASEIVAMHYSFINENEKRANTDFSLETSNRLSEF